MTSCINFWHDKRIVGRQHGQQQPGKCRKNWHIFQECTISKDAIYILVLKILRIYSTFLHLYPLSMIMFPRRLQSPCGIKFKRKTLLCYLGVQNICYSTKSDFVLSQKTFCLPQPIWKECFLNKRWKGNGRNHPHSFLELFQG